jgi:hypothetical protein
MDYAWLVGWTLEEQGICSVVREGKGEKGGPGWLINRNHWSGQKGQYFKNNFM